MPFWKRKSLPFADTGTRNTALSVGLSLAARVGPHPQLHDSTFTTVSADWFLSPPTQRKLRTHFWGLPRYTSQAFDCENFAVELVQWLCREAALANVEASPQAYVYCVDNRVPWAGVGDGYHALNLVEFDTGPRVIEPQSIRDGMIHAPLADYPNKAFKIYT